MVSAWRALRSLAVTWLRLSEAVRNTKERAKRCIQYLKHYEQWISDIRDTRVFDILPYTGR